jgi:Holliday junction resolvase
MASDYQSKVIKEYQDKGFTVLKTIRLNRAGLPDLICLKDGETIFIEVKEPKDTLKALQKYWIDRLRLDGFEAFAVQKGKGKIY